MTKSTLLEEFKELIEEITAQVISEVHMRELAEDVVSRSYKAEIQDTLKQLSEEVSQAEKNAAAVKEIYAENVTALLDTMKAEITEKVNQEIGQLNSQTEKIIEKVVGDYEIRMMGVISQKVDTLEQHIKNGLETQEINYLAEIGKVEVMILKLKNDIHTLKEQEEARLQKQQVFDKKFKVMMAAQGVTILMLIGLIIYMVSGV